MTLTRVICPAPSLHGNYLLILAGSPPHAHAAASLTHARTRRARVMLGGGQCEDVTSLIRMDIAVSDGASLGLIRGARGG